MFPSSEATAKDNFFPETSTERIPATFDHRCPPKQASSEEGDTFLSDDCDEKRSYTPQPRQSSMFGGGGGPKLNRGQSTNQIAQMTSNRSMMGLGGGGSLANRQNNQNLSCLNNRSGMASDNSRDLSTYISKDKRRIGEQAAAVNKSGFLSSLFN